MTTQNLPGTDAARHGTGDADLTIMLAAHDAFRRDLTRLVRAAAAADLSDPARRRSVAAGWELFKHELHLHHTAEDEVDLAGAPAAAGAQRARPVGAGRDGGGARAHRPAAGRGRRRVRRRAASDRRPNVQAHQSARLARRRGRRPPARTPWPTSSTPWSPR